MGANQIDRYGNQNLSAFGPLQHPTRQMFGVRGAPGNTINHATSYWVGNHSKRVFGESVDIVSGIGWDKVDPDNPAYRFVNVYRVVTQPRRVRLQRSRPPDARGVTAPRRRGRPGRGEHLVRGARSGRRRDHQAPTGDEQKLLREVIDPKSLRDKEVKA